MAQPEIHRIAVPTPFPVGDVNVHLLRGEPLTLVDTGPNLATSLAALEAGLAAAGVRVEDLQLIVLTHQHSDHIGLASVLQQRSGALVASFAPLAPWLAAFARSAADDDEYARVLMARHGVPEDLNAALAVTAAATRAFGGASVAVERPLVDGSTLAAGGRDWRVMHRPGHSPSDLLLHDERDGLVLGGDHLMRAVASNAILTRPLSAAAAGGADAAGAATVPATGDVRPRPLLDYRTSLRRTRELPAGVVILPGHGPPVCAHRELICERLRVHERRARKLLRTLRSGPMNAHQIALAMWGRVAITQPPLMISEVLGHLDMLLEDGSVVERAGGEQVSFEIA